jgi:hypothetical protein
MKRALMVLTMGLFATSAALHATSGTIRFRGMIVQGTCADTVSVNRSPEPRQVRQRCETGATGAGAAQNAPIYTERTTMVSGHTGIDALDYYLDMVRSRSGGQVQLLTRDYR